MDPRCIKAVTQAAGRALTDAQIKTIDDRMLASMRRLAREDIDAWRGMPMEERIKAAAAQAMKDIKAETARKVENAQRQALKAAETAQRVKQQRKLGAKDQTTALVRDMENTGKYIEGIKGETLSGMLDLLEAGKDGSGAGIGRRALMALFDADNPAMSRDLAVEIFGMGRGDTGNTVAARAAKAWLETIEGLRTRFNAAGGDVRRLDYGYLPQPHDQGRVMAAGRDEWVNKILPKLDRSRYVDENGTRLSETQLREVLAAAYATISTDGLNKLTPGQFKGKGARANAGSDARQIHFKDADSYLQYMAEFGRGSMYDAMVGHVGGMARDIGLVERYGPNPEQQMHVQMDAAEIADGKGKRTFAMRAGSYWNVLSGAAGTPQTPRLAQVGQDLRNIQTAAKLGSAVISSVTDIGTLFITTGYNKLPYWDLFRNIGGQTKRETRQFLKTHGVIADSLLSDLNRWSGDMMGKGWTGRMANSTMKLSLMNAWTDSLRNAFQMTMMSGMGKLAGKEWGKLTEFDRQHLGRHGITQEDWGVIQRAELTKYGGRDFLTPEALYATGDERAQEVVAKVLGLIREESEFAVINPDLATRAMTTGGGAQAGTAGGELARTVMQFKSFPIAMVSRHWRRLMDSPKVEGAPVIANRLAYGMAMAMTLTILGAVAYQTKQIIAGKDPIAMDTPKFWTQAAIQGGAGGLIGDLLLTSTSEDRSMGDRLFRLLGPTAGAVSDLWELTKGNLDEVIAGKDPHAAAEAVRFLKSNTPLVNLWYTKAALEHAGLQQLQENLSPGYLSRMRNRARKEFGQDYWWEPGEVAPERAPDLSTIGGQ